MNTDSPKLELIQELIDNIPDVVYFKDKQGRLVLVNKAHADGLGLRPEDVIGKTDFDFFPKKQAQQMTSDDKKVISTGQPLIDEIEHTTQPDGSKHCVSTTKIPRKDKNGNIIGIMGITRDITKRVLHDEEQQRQLQKLKDQVQFEKNKLEEVLSIEEELIAIIKLDQLVEFVVEKTRKILGAEKCSLMLIDESDGELCIRAQRGLDERVLIEEAIDMEDSISSIIAQRGKPVLVRDIETDQSFARPKRSSYSTKSFMSVPMKMENNLVGLINVADKQLADGVFTKVDLKILSTLARQVAIAIENAKLYRELNYMTISDPLTHMYNYRYFARSLDDEIKRIKRYNENLCLLMIDIDDFKPYNDTFGHLEGDKLLQKFSKVLNENIRAVDVACRYAGDEFVVILPKTNSVEAEIVADKLRHKISQMKVNKPITVSIGIAQYDKNMDRHSLVLKADSALYDAKKAGRNCVRCYEKT